MLSRTTGKEDLRGGLGDVEVVGVRKRGTPDAVGLVYRGKAGRSLRPAGQGLQEAEMESKTIFPSGTVIRAALGLVLTCHSLCPKVTDLSCAFHLFQNHILPKKLVSKVGDLSLREAASILGPRLILPKDLLDQFSSQINTSPAV